MNYPKISIIILNWNGVDDTIECLDSLLNVTYPNYEIIIVDNASSGDDVKILIDKYGDSIHVIANDQNYGFAEGNNIGFRYALQHGADYLMPLNNDVIVDPNFLNELINVTESNETYGMAGATIYMYYDRSRIECAGGKIHWWLGILDTYGGIDRGQYRDVAERDFVYANGCIIKKAVIEKIGLLNPLFFFSIEEYDYCSRAKRAGFKVMNVPSSRIWHKKGASAAKLKLFPETQTLVKSKSGFRNYKYAFQLFKENGPPVLFVFPFIIFTSPIGNFLISVWRGDWRIIWEGTMRLLGLNGREK